MKIYTKGGDKGQTQIYADKVVRLSKDDQVLECYGTLDELNAHVGLLTSYITQSHPHSIVASQLPAIQQSLFQIGFAVSATSKLNQQDVASLEHHIDQLQLVLPAQVSFILPGGCMAASQAHVCRTVARRAERTLVALLVEHPVPEVCLQFINRLSDYFFVVARSLNHELGLSDVKV
ncbi:MAG: cob(I)yrinic acid a,c-diamide adenosyltransferase [Paraglaciecola sp.]|uniref:cob(I)yrinic acid a,c-diamide adenosyltransferase n=1 Tax=Pseudomonadati TaxID=3379134 RepID=UPI00273EF8C8|nr:cob(I)yrinic acid a,c-diamide adenosyltransferase [Paraglaciecola sp.]MDP5030808.1 cob(I)yrinic acid a,c-diamide adenosyltransferase [Paraglaciecola sp.]MDP5129567.1 cob(I)yrinic acid a,c-diamide adenosyltransferase [Paraglaciecola sp.]